MVRLRMKALGRKHRPFFRICAMDSRTGRDSCPIEELGHYDPLCKDAETQTVLNVSRVRYWLSVGAAAFAQGSVPVEQEGRQEARAGRGVASCRESGRGGRRPRPRRAQPAAT